LRGCGRVAVTVGGRARDVDVVDDRPPHDTAVVERRKLNLKAADESSISHFSFKRLVPVGFHGGLIGSTCTALPLSRGGPSPTTAARTAELTPSAPMSMSASTTPPPDGQGVTLVHLSAPRKRFLWDRGAFSGCLERVYGVFRGIMGYQGITRGVQSNFGDRNGSG
jgi:hypothetical protein